MSDGSTVDAIARGWEGRPIVAIVDLDALATNVRTLRSLIGPDVRLMAVVKGNGYGHGAEPVGRVVLAAGADLLAVATVDEGAQLRSAGIDAEILVMGPLGRVDRARAVGLGLAVVVSDASFARALAADAKASLVNDKVPVHLKVDTGMRRFGAMPEAVVDLAKTIAGLPELRLDGIMTHLAAADDPDPASARDQVARFDTCVGALAAASIDVPCQHVANSATTLRFPEFHRGMVRVGIALYGLRPDADLPLPAPMRPVMRVAGRISRVIPLADGDTVSYGRAYRSPGEERAALIPIGYADGYRRALSSTGWMAIDGARADVLGRVCMDQTVVRVPAASSVTAGDPVTIVGDGTEETAGAPTFDELAALTGTISYELATGIAPRLPKLYVQEGMVVAVSDLAGTRWLK